MNNERGAVLVFVTLIIVLLLILVGMGLDTGHLAYIRSQGQPAVDAAALSATSAIPTGNPALVKSRAAAFNSKNTYLNSPGNAIGDLNVTLINYNPTTGAITLATGVTATSTGNANGARVALENSNPYASNVGAAMQSPLFLTPLLNLFGQAAQTTADVNVSATAVIRASPDLPIAIEQGRCDLGNPQKLLQTDSNVDNSGYTTFWIQNASKTVVSNLIKASLTCDQIPAVGLGYCTELNNGQIWPLHDEFEALFKTRSDASSPTGYKCYMIPVVKDNQPWNQCSHILQFAKFCPVKTSEGVGIGKAKSEDGTGYDKYLYGNVYCGENPYNTASSSCYTPTLVRDIKSGM
jgi:Flp pilus assembly protein TadG